MMAVLMIHGDDDGDGEDDDNPFHLCRRVNTLWRIGQLISEARAA
jgi:hypothetical protein